MFQLGCGWRIQGDCHLCSVVTSQHVPCKAARLVCCACATVTTPESVTVKGLPSVCLAQIPVLQGSRVGNRSHHTNEYLQRRQRSASGTICGMD
jgi:hypothetical protein